MDTTSSTLILEKVTVSKDGKTFQGTGILKTIQGIDQLDPNAPVLGSLNINITGKRVTIDPNQLP